jgi:hypothetical protein
VSFYFHHLYFLLFCDSSNYRAAWRPGIPRDQAPRGGQKKPLN